MLLQQLGRFNLSAHQAKFIFQHTGRSSSNNFTRNVGEDDWQLYFIGLLPTGDIIEDRWNPIRFVRESIEGLTFPSICDWL